jgi:hypothetical protein
VVFDGERDLPRRTRVAAPGSRRERDEANTEDDDQARPHRQRLARRSRLVENVTGSAFNDSVTGSNEANMLKGASLGTNALKRPAFHTDATAPTTRSTSAGVFRMLGPSRT